MKYKCQSCSYEFEANTFNSPTLFCPKCGERKAKATISYHEESPIEILEKAANEGNPEAIFRLAHRYRDGNDVEKNDGKYLELLHRSSDMGFAPASAELGLYLMDQGKEKEGFLFLKKAKKEGDSSILLKLADCYENGIGCSKDAKLAVDCLKNATNLDLEGAHFAMAMHLKKHDSLHPWSYIPYLKQAADKGDGEASYLLAREFYDGRLSQKDMDMVSLYLRQASKGGYKEGETLYAYLLAEGQFKKEGNRKKGVEMLQKDADKGDPWACYYLSRLYRKGVYLAGFSLSGHGFDSEEEIDLANRLTILEADPMKASDYLEKAAKHPDVCPEAARELALRIARGKENYLLSEAYALLEKAADSGILDAKLDLACLQIASYHKKGEIKEGDPIIGDSRFEKLIADLFYDCENLTIAPGYFAEEYKRERRRGCFFLAICLYVGLWKESDPAEAKRFLPHPETEMEASMMTLIEATINYSWFLQKKAVESFLLPLAEGSLEASLLIYGLGKRGSQFVTKEHYKLALANLRSGSDL